MNKHTPGPWVADAFALSFEILALNNPLIAVVQSRHCDTPEEMIANAQLIAAAPDLLEALQAAAESSGFQYMTFETRNMIDAAINKATGERP